GPGRRLRSFGQAVPVFKPSGATVSAIPRNNPLCLRFQNRRAFRLRL
ncbi:MAG: hypothetical protein, partial [Olavius algarvensis Delta 4 endosymbiont]